ncbi:hypothetical protein IMSHALPRED_002900 [Imshaugia aleurites]|uniref:Rhodopsin domain-containing protein n=1 Tax=Imshaugia aleurites TaxID=172621 RepID=A0A8H3PIQ4_9LECA|nr:hypothetical protein IMSHALPRED_002900 [Imshaugia aleurites]
MSTKYASKPPPGVVPDYTNPPRNAGVTRLEVVAPLLMGIAALFVALRLYVRKFIVNKMGWDDCEFDACSSNVMTSRELELNKSLTVAICVSLLLTAATAGCALATTRFGLGYHLYVLPLHEFSPGFLKVELAQQEVYTAASLAVRVAIVLLVLRIVSPIRRYRLAVYVLVFVITVYHVAKAFAFLFGCVPIALNWNITIKGGHCIDRFKLAVGFNALNVITDVLFIIAISIYRCYIQNTLVGVTDVTWFYPDVHLWACIELQVGIICGCMPPLKTLFPRILPASWFSQSPSEPHRLSHLGTHDKKGFLYLAESGPRSTNGAFTGDKASRRPSNPKVPDWYDVEPGLLGDAGGFNNNMGAFETRSFHCRRMRGRIRR